MNSDSKFDPFVLRHINNSFRHAALNVDSAPNGVDNTGELSERAVAGILDNASAMIRDFGVE